MWAPVVPSDEIIAHTTANSPAELLPYLSVFTKQPATQERWAEYVEHLRRTDEEIIDDLDRAGIAKALITGFDEASTCGRTFVSNDAVAAIAERHPDRFIAFAGADVMAGPTSLRELERRVTAGFRGLSLRPFMIGRPASDRAYLPFYAGCAELGIPVSIHTSANWTWTRPSELGHPRWIDEVACQFPDLVLIMSHAGYPWVLEACLVAWKHPNVYLDLAAHRPKYFTTAGAGWESLMRLGQTTIQDKVLYGTGAFLIGRPARELVDELRDLPISDVVLEKWLWRNAARLLGLGGLGGTPTPGPSPPALER
jgi:predicted TIM-barrel fold metal-dependent hydrolase